MWPDNETEKDFLNFSGVAGTVAEIITQATGRPTSIGISGSWGAGKSSMIKLVRAALAEKDQNDPEQFIYVEFNAWLYQGYDDARAALLEVIATKLNEESEKRKTGTDKAKELLERVNWLRAAKLGAGSALALALGLPPTWLIGEAVAFGKKVRPLTSREQSTPNYRIINSPISFRGPNVNLRGTLSSFVPELCTDSLCECGCVRSGLAVVVRW